MQDFSETNQITEEQFNSLKSTGVDDSKIESFFEKLDNNYGDGEVLSFSHIENIFKKGFINILTCDYLTVYVDTLRILNVLKRKEIELLNIIEWKDVQNLHDDLIKNYKTEYSETISDSFLEATKPFNNFKQIDGLKVELILTINELNNEGSSMEHCIATYYQYVIDKNYIGFRVFNTDENNKERLTLGCYRKNDKLFFNQLKGRGNSPATKNSCQKIIHFCKENNISIPETEVYDLLPAINN